MNEDTKDKPLNEAAPIPKDQKAFDTMMEKNPLFKTAFDLRCEGHNNAYIAGKIGRSITTLRNWWHMASLPARHKFSPNKPAEKPSLEKAENRVAEGEDPEEVLDSLTTAAAAELKEQAQQQEDLTLAAIAESQATAADKYQHYIAAAGIKLLRDSMQTLKGPRTVRELSELDQLIRRNLGLNAKTGGGNGGRMQIDISILNNGLADKGKGTLASLKKDTIDADVVHEKVKKTKKR